MLISGMNCVVKYTRISKQINYQIEHHLFPTIAGCHLPAICKIVEAKAKKYGLQYQSFPSFTSALVSHYRQLRTLGERPNSSTGV